MLLTGREDGAELVAEGTATAPQGGKRSLHRQLERTIELLSRPWLARCNRVSTGDKLATARPLRGSRPLAT